MTPDTFCLVTRSMTNHDQPETLVVDFCLVTLVTPRRGDKQMTNQAGRP